MPPVLVVTLDLLEEFPRRPDIALLMPTAAAIRVTVPISAEVAHALPMPAVMPLVEHAIQDSAMADGLPDVPTVRDLFPLPGERRTVATGYGRSVVLDDHVLLIVLGRDWTRPAVQDFGAMLVAELPDWHVILVAGDGVGDRRSERTRALALANRVLDRDEADPDDDLAVLARQLLRAEQMRDADPALRVARDRVVGEARRLNLETPDRGDGDPLQDLDDALGALDEAEAATPRAVGPVGEWRGGTVGDLAAILSATYVNGVDLFGLIALREFDRAARAMFDALEPSIPAGPSAELADGVSSAARERQEGRAMTHGGVGR